jgi:hypothetical protein
VSYRVDLSFLTIAELDEVAAMLGAGTPEPAVRDLVEQWTYRNLLAAAGGIHPNIGGDEDDNRLDLAHVGTAGETYGR